MRARILSSYFMAGALFLGAFSSAPQDPTRSTKPVPNDTAAATHIDNKLVQKIAAKLMAPCCWSETADIHQSEAAVQIREQIRAALGQGYTEQQIINAFVQYYGERILAKPRAKGFNLTVWILPFVALLLGGWWTVGYLRRVKMPPQAPKKMPKKSKPAKQRDRRSYETRVEEELREFE